MRPTVVRANQRVVAQARIVLNAWEAPAFRPSPFRCSDQLSPPPLLLPAVEEDGDPQAVPELILKGTVQLHLVPRDNQQAPDRCAGG
jgi:hypothetical protein